MKIRKAIPVLMAVGLIFAGQINSANAYFTTYVTAKGGYVVSWEHHEEMTETFSEWTKYVTIASKADSVPTFIRVKVFGDTKYDLKIMGNDWEYNPADDFYYYKKDLQGGQITTPLSVKISNIPVSPREGDNFNVVVVYESIVAEYEFAVNENESDENESDEKQKRIVIKNPMECDWQDTLGSGVVANAEYNTEDTVVNDGDTTGGEADE